MRRLTALFPVAIALVLLGSAVAGAQSRGKEIVVGLGAEPRTMLAVTIVDWTTNNMLEHIYDRLLDRDAKTFKPKPMLAESWKIVNDTTWEFKLRKGVKFHNGEDFTAEDVVFSTERMQSPGSQIPTRAPRDMKAVKVDDYAVDFVLTSPNPILHYEWDTWYMMSKKWAEANGATQAQAASATSLSPFALKANGTGPFIIVSHEPGVKTVFKPNPNWWGKVEHNLDEVIFQTIKSDATRVAALLSGAGSGHRARQGEPQRNGADRP
jgi:peptide/nickel transport system substrate-binding protein